MPPESIIQFPPVYSHSQLEAGNGVCAAGHSRAARAGIRMMELGGNAFDSMVAAAFTTFVMEPESCGLGGYGHISAYIAETREFLSIDAYCRAPARASAQMFKVDTTRALSYYGHPVTKGDLAYVGWLAIAVPGAVAGFCDLHSLLGRLPLKKVLTPAIEAAEEGVPLTFRHQLEITAELDRIKRYSDTAAALLVGGKVPSIQSQTGGGDRLDTKVLGAVLKRIAKYGKSGFHGGPIAEEIGNYIRSNGGILSANDVSTYKPRILRESPSIYRNHRYVSCYDQVAYEALNILGQFDVRGLGADSFGYRHITAESLALAFADNMMHYGDPDFVDSPVNGLSSLDFAKVRRRLIKINKALPRPVKAGDPWPFETCFSKPKQVDLSTTLARRKGTSCVATADSKGNLASACVSIGSSYGSLIYIPQVGIFMNNAMQNFDPRPDHPSHIAPGKMPIFAAPALVSSARGGLSFAASGSGGYRIEPGVLQTFMNHVDHKMAVQKAVDHPRVHSQGGPTYVDSRIDASVIRRLQKVGHDVCILTEQPGANHFGRVAAVTRNARTRVLSAGAGPAWMTSIAGF